MPETKMFLIEVPKADDRREFVVDCPHGTTRTLVNDYRLRDEARGSGVFGKLIRKHRSAIAKAVAEGREDVLCRCQPDRKPSVRLPLS